MENKGKCKVWWTIRIAQDVEHADLIMEVNSDKSEMERACFHTQTHGVFQELELSLNSKEMELFKAN